MKNARFVDAASIVIAGATLLFSFVFFFRNTNEFVGSLTAAIMTAGLVWATYIIMRWLILANRN
jgi:hypothetical protein